MGRGANIREVNMAADMETFAPELPPEANTVARREVSSLEHTTVANWVASSPELTPESDRVALALGIKEDETVAPMPGLRNHVIT